MSGGCTAATISPGIQMQDDDEDAVPVIIMMILPHMRASQQIDGANRYPGTCSPVTGNTLGNLMVISTT